MRKCVSATFTVDNFPPNAWHNHLEDCAGLEVAQKRSLVAEDHSSWQPHTAQREAGTITTFLTKGTGIATIVNTVWSVLPCASHSPACSTLGQQQIFGLQLIKTEIPCTEEGKAGLSD